MKKFDKNKIDIMTVLYKKYYIDRQFERTEVFRALKKKYLIENVLYPGSFVHITPSFVFRKTVYVDNDKGAKNFFKDITLVKDIVNTRKFYKQESEIQFLGLSYNNPMPFEKESFDLLISHYAGIISQACKKYLRPGGLLLVNNSHADASVAYLDDDFEFIAIINVNRKSLISEDNLTAYFIPKKEQEVTINALISKQKGIGYIKTADLYLFRKVK